MNNQKNAHKEDTPLVSIIVITYNSSKFVLETLESAKAQTYENIELIVSDDASTDDTVEICRRWLDKNKERFVRTELITVPENTGIPANCNRGLRAAKGEWIKYIAGDDALMEDIIKKYITLIKKYPAIEFVHSDAAVYHETFQEENRLIVPGAKGFKINNKLNTAGDQFKILLRVNKVRASSAMIHKSVFKSVGVFDESLKYLEDLPMWLKITQNNIKLHFYNDIGIKYRKHSGSTTNKNITLLSYYKNKEKEVFYWHNYSRFLTTKERLLKLYILFFHVLFYKTRHLISKRNIFSRTLLFFYFFVGRSVKLAKNHIVKNYV